MKLNFKFSKRELIRAVIIAIAVILVIVGAGLVVKYLGG